MARAIKTLKRLHRCRCNHGTFWAASALIGQKRGSIVALLLADTAFRIAMIARRDSNHHAEEIGDSLDHIPSPEKANWLYASDDARLAVTRRGTPKDL